MINREKKILEITNAFNVPILFIIFNRIDTTRQVFEVIRKVSPRKLYIASDGPRETREGEKDKVESVRDYVLQSIDWECEVKTLFRDDNLGCGKAVSSAITWFFENEESGIILEDDCLPSLSFFPYCQELLEKYKDNESIYHIAGHNPLTETRTRYSYYFARIHHCWGWASWRRAWEKYSFDITGLDEFIAQKKMNKIFSGNIEENYWIDIFKRMEGHGIDTWDYQWTYAIFKNNGICINPAKNLVTNIGFGIDATHTISTDYSLNNQQRYEISYINHPRKIKISSRLLRKIHKIVFGLYGSSKLRSMIKRSLRLLKKNVMISSE